MKKVFQGWVVLALVIYSAPLVLAQSDRFSRAAAKADLVGTWEMVSVRPVRDKNDPVFFPYQRFVFNRDGSMKYMTSDKPYSKEWLEKFQKQSPEIDYFLDQKGILTLSWQKQPHSESFLCAYVLNDVPTQTLSKLPLERRKEVPKTGDLTLSFFNTAGRISYQKVLSRVV
jgi:hypothetical protein